MLRNPVENPDNIYSFLRLKKLGRRKLIVRAAASCLQPLVAIMDWFSRKVLAWRLSNGMESSFCIEALKEALAKYGKPEIMKARHRVMPEIW